jgi:transposase
MITESQFRRIADCLRRQHGNVGITNLQLHNALSYAVKHGCKWHGLQKHFGNRHTIYTQMNSWSKAGVLDQVFARL